ncbi:Inner membrane ABC transporter permease protein YcjP [Paenibacillus sp. CECT 9249]|uniref:carbohydrate ABC transporter permease n=1 Tax=Paenibacillus sp. CECT 9249 TaxID=2845385 RepID=UPI001E39F8BC|nr:carbohydrate ABC transporter permease [Paenibacillus sp. CECT 9249]CAH0120628.1 Inner membrane ABC transporter permease protein YcjP [Paenibacillus sp. CECT 9249]
MGTKNKPKNGILLHIVLMGYVIISLYPLFWAFQNSFKRHVDIIVSPFAPIKNFTFQNYIDAWNTSNVNVYLANSFLVSTVSSVATVFLAAMTAYALVRIPYKLLNAAIMGILLLAIMVPGATILVPLYSFVRKFEQYFGFQIYDTYMSLIFPYVTFGLAISVVIIKAFMSSMPKELEEAAVMDGLNIYGLFFRIVLPLCLPALVSVFIVNYLNNWNEFIMANLLLSKENLRTLAVGVAAFKDMLNTNYGGLYAATMYSVIPVVIVYIFLQDRIIEGLTSGSLKG